MADIQKQGVLAIKNFNFRQFLRDHGIPVGFFIKEKIMRRACEEDEDVGIRRTEKRDTRV